MKNNLIRGGFSRRNLLKAGLLGTASASLVVGSPAQAQRFEYRYNRGARLMTIDQTPFGIHADSWRQDVSTLDVPVIEGIEAIEPSSPATALASAYFASYEQSQRIPSETEAEEIDIEAFGSIKEGVVNLLETVEQELNGYLMDESTVFYMIGGNLLWLALSSTPQGRILIAFSPILPGLLDTGWYYLSEAYDLIYDHIL